MSAQQSRQEQTENTARIVAALEAIQAAQEGTGFAEVSGTPATPANAHARLYFDNTATPRLRAIDDSGVTRGLESVFNASTASQSIADTTRVSLAGSLINIPKSKLKVGTRLKWKFSVTKTAAGSATSTIDVSFGTAGAVADTARLSFTKPIGTAAADAASFEIDVVIRSIGASGVAVGTMTMLHNLAATGHATIPVVVATAISAGFDMTVADLIASVNFTAGASDALTVERVEAAGSNF